MGRFARVIVPVLLALAVIEAGVRVAGLEQRAVRYAHGAGAMKVLVLDGFAPAVEPDAATLWRLAPDLARVPIEGHVRRFAIRFGFATGPDGTRRVPGADGAPAAHTVIALGDSCTFGFGVGDGETWPAQLQAMRPAAHVVNLAAPGWTSLQGLAALDARLARGERPAAIVAGFGLNDAASWDGIADDARLALARLPTWVGPLAHSAALRAARLALGARALATRPVADRAAPRVPPDAFAAALRALAERAAACGARLVFIEWPLRSDLEPARGPGGLAPAFIARYSAYRAALRAVAGAAHVPLVDAHAAYGEAPADAVMGDFVHPNAAGAARVARAVAAALDAPR